MSLLFAFLISAYASPRIDSGRVSLGAAVEGALVKVDPQFQMFTPQDYLPSVRLAFTSGPGDETPMAVVGDFNGDRLPDVVVMGRARGERLVYAVLSHKNGYVAQLVDREALPEQALYPAMAELGAEYDEDQNEAWRESGVDTYLSVQRAGYREPGVVTFKLDTLILETFRSDSRYFPFKKGRLSEWEPTRARGS